MNARDSRTPARQADRIIADDCPITDIDLVAIKHVRRQMLNNGYRPLAIHSRWSLACDADRAGKAPVGKNWQNGQPLYRLFGNHSGWSRAGANTGLLLGFGEIPVQALDADIDDPAVMAAMLASVKRFVAAGSLVRTRANSPRLTMLLRCEPGVLKQKLQGECGAVERLALGQQTVVHGTHPSGVPLDWLRGRSPWTTRAAALPFMDEVTVDAMFAAIAASGALGAKLDRTSASGSRPGVAGPRGDIAEAFKACATQCRSIVPAVREFLRETGGRGTYRHDTIVSLAGTFVRLGWPVEQAAKLLTENADKFFGEGSWAKEVKNALTHATRRQTGAGSRRLHSNPES